MVARSTELGPLVVIVGETCSGKSAMALKLAQEFNGEIIAADSWTVRAEMDIGSAKPSCIDQIHVRHHLLDIVRPDQDFTAAVFKQLAIQSIDDITSRGMLPILVGGTGLYIDGVIYDYSFLPAGTAHQRVHLNNLSLTELLKIISARGLDLSEIDIRNKRRLIRLIETNGAMPLKRGLRENTLIIGLSIERELLSHLVTQRVDNMIKEGLENEVSKLVKKYGWGAEGLKGVGYAQWREYFSGTATLDETRKKIVKATLDLAKRQRTWFKRNKSIHWIDTPVNWQDVVELTTTFLDK